MTTLPAQHKRISLTYFRRNQESVYNDVEQTREPIVVTKYGKPLLVVMPVDTYEQLKTAADDNPSTAA